jgi:hypothetical protein
LFGAVRPEVDHPHDFWAAAAGAISLLIAIGLYLYDLVGDWIRPVLTLLVFGILMAGIFAERWTRDFRTAQLVVEKPPPQGAATGTPQTQLFHVTTGASLWTPFVPSMSITPVSVIHNDGSISPVNITLFVTLENMQSVSDTIESYGLEVATNPSGPWVQMCPVDLTDGRVWWVGDRLNPTAVEMNGLQSQLIEREIGEHKTESGWTFLGMSVGIGMRTRNISIYSRGHGRR